MSWNEEPVELIHDGEYLSYTHLQVEIALEFSSFASYSTARQKRTRVLEKVKAIAGVEPTSSGSQ